VTVKFLNVGEEGNGSSTVNLDCREIEFQGDDCIQLPQDRDDLRSTEEKMFYKQLLSNIQGLFFHASKGR
jgi:hypothetical protein